MAENLAGAGTARCPSPSTWAPSPTSRRPWSSAPAASRSSGTTSTPCARSPPRLVTLTNNWYHLGAPGTWTRRRCGPRSRASPAVAPATPGPRLRRPRRRLGGRLGRRHRPVGRMAPARFPSGLAAARRRASACGSAPFGGYGERRDARLAWAGRPRATRSTAAANCLCPAGRPTGPTWSTCSPVDGGRRRLLEARRRLLRLRRARPRPPRRPRRPYRPGRPLPATSSPASGPCGPTRWSPSPSAPTPRPGGCGRSTSCGGAASTTPRPSTPAPASTASTPTSTPACRPTGRRRCPVSALVPFSIVESDAASYRDPADLAAWARHCWLARRPGHAAPRPVRRPRLAVARRVGGAGRGPGLGPRRASTSWPAAVWCWATPAPARSTASSPAWRRPAIACLRNPSPSPAGRCRLGRSAGHVPHGLRRGPWTAPAPPHPRSRLKYWSSEIPRETLPRAMPPLQLVREREQHEAVATPQVVGALSPLAVAHCSSAVLVLARFAGRRRRRHLARGSAFAASIGSSCHRPGHRPHAGRRCRVRLGAGQRLRARRHASALPHHHPRRC